MDQNFQTSFIPKKPMIEKRVNAVHPIGLFTIISIFILFATLIGTGGLYLYKGTLTKTIATKESDLNTSKNRFEPSKITELQALDKRLRASTEILSNHIAVTPLFQALSAITMKTVSFTKFSYTLPDDQQKDSKVQVSMSGTAVGYRSVALQSDLFTNSEKGKNFKEPVFSNLTLDDKGNVNFDLSFSVDRSFINYKQMLQAETQS